jgi:ELWxxDGT repeat protein
MRRSVTVLTLARSCVPSQPPRFFECLGEDVRDALVPPSAPRPFLSSTTRRCRRLGTPFSSCSPAKQLRSRWPRWKMVVFEREGCFVRARAILRSISSGILAATVPILFLVACSSTSASEPSASPAPADPPSTPAGQQLLFQADDGIHGKELWKTDGTPTGTVIVKDIAPGRAGSYPNSFTTVGSTIFFSATDPKKGWELWKTDGTASGTKLVKDIAPGTTSSGLVTLTAVGARLFFTTYGPRGHALWKSDGTAEGTVPITRFASDSIGQLTDCNGTLFFELYDRDVGHELWKSDGTRAGTVFVAVAVARPRWDPGRFSMELTAVGDRLYFRGYDPVHGLELWESNGEPNGTGIVKDIEPGQFGSDPDQLTELGGVLFFAAYSSTEGSGLWRSDGTAAGTSLVNGAVFHLSSPISVGDQLYFGATDGVHGKEPWISDGTTAGTHLVRDVIDGRGGSFPQGFTRVGSSVFFEARDVTHGYELWRTDGTDGGTTLVADIWAGSESSLPEGLRALGSILSFSANDGTHGREPWISDGSQAGTSMLVDLRPGERGSNPSGYYVVGSSP